MQFSFEPIGHIRSCFKEKFGIPRQPGLARDAVAKLEILPPYNREEAFRGLEVFSHLWIVFVFHQNHAEGWRATVRPPRLGGNRRIGVFASRSGFRPNPVGISAVAFEGIEMDKGRISLLLKGIDLLDGTPVLDVKPYIPYADSFPEAGGGYASDPPSADMQVLFDDQASEACVRREKTSLPGLRRLIVQLLEQDPRPAYRSGNSDTRKFGIRLFDLDVRWEVEGNTIRVTAIVEV